MGPLPKIHKIVSGVGSWIWLLGPGGILWAVLSGVSAELAPISHYGWAADVLSGVIFTSIAMAGMGLLLSGWRYCFPLKRPVAQTAQSTQQNTKQRALEIIFTEDKEHFRTSVGPNEQVRKTLFLMVRNIGDGFLTECFLSVESATPPPKGAQLGFSLFSGETILPNQKKFIDLAGFNEVPAKSGPKWELAYNDFITIYLHNPGYIGGAVSLDGSEPSEGCVLAVVAGAQECSVEKIHIRLWVEMPARKLRAALM